MFIGVAPGVLFNVHFPLFVRIAPEHLWILGGDNKFAGITTQLYISGAEISRV